jgi:glycosyltransferase involved in cell wall biosynthesis
MKNKKKVAILYSGGKSFGGIEQYLVSLLGNIKDESIEIEVLSLGNWDLTQRLKEIGINPVIFSDKRINLRAISEIGSYLKQHQFDLLVSQGTVSNAYARAISWIYKIPNLVTVHSNQADDYPNPIVRVIYGFIDRVMRFMTIKYIAVSKFIRHKMIQSGIPSNSISVIYNGVSFEEPTPRPHKRLVIGSVGRLHHVKGFDLLIEAFSLLDNQRLRLKIAGDGDELDNLKKLADDLGVADRVEFVGFQKDINAFIDSLDIYVQPSRSEGFGLAVVEAMSRCLPVIVTPVGSLGEIVHDGETGLVATGLAPNCLVDEISYMVENYEASKKMGENARDFVVEKFNKDKWIKATLNAYKEAMK